MSLISFVCASPSASWTPSVNPDYGTGSGRKKRYHQPVDLSDGGDIYSYKHGESGDRAIGSGRMPSADLTTLLAFFDTIHGDAKAFTFNDLDGETYTSRLNNGEISWREVEPGFYEVQFSLRVK